MTSIRELAFSARLAILFCVLLACSPAATFPESPIPAATFSLDRGHPATANLDGLWRFHIGDNPLFSAPGFDDSGWALVHSDQAWSTQQMPGVSGAFWYRATVWLPPASQSISLSLPSLIVNYQVFVDGKLVGGVGAMPPNENDSLGVPAVFLVPSNYSAPANQPRKISLSIRCWSSSDEYPTGLRPGVLIGASPIIQRGAVLEAHDVFWRSFSGLFLTLLEAIAGFASLGLFLFRRNEREYLWYSLVNFLSVASRCLTTWNLSHSYKLAEYILLRDILTQASALAMIAFLYQLLSGKRGWLFRIAVGALLADFGFAVADLVPWILSPYWLLLKADSYYGVNGILMMPFSLWVLTFIWSKARDRDPDARLLLPAITLSALCSPLSFLLTSGFYLNLWSRDSVQWFYHTSQWPVPFSVQNVADLLLLIAMLTVLIRRFSRTRLQEEAYKREREAARAVQQILIPQELVQVRGFQIDSVYSPFGEVGGDFFQVVPTDSGGVLVAIGDVSGKGIPAAMTVSLLVGTLRTLAHYTQSPAAMLSAMNQRMIGRASGGFTTCLIAHADSSGRITIANAGHIAPYQIGKELPVENGLPLGIIGDANYTQLTFPLAPDQQLTFMTDGIVEARSQSGELFGFERAAAFSNRSAESIAQAAQAFGQDDDITVLTLTRLAAN